ncbi:hypothetical protein DBR32_15435 [Taibaiella sp. KBW10]|nr:hypothetical protein DBR32_15435 [Taibaiella sp. KBW10]
MYSQSSAAPVADDGLISKETANRMIQSYLVSVGANNTTTADTPNLYSLIMDAEKLRTYLNNPDIKGVKIMFAHTMDYINSGKEGLPCGLKSGALTVVIAGFDKDGNYIYAPGDRVPDRAKPCPVSCPTEGSAKDNLLP